jgi:hypothetical protein
MPARVTQKRLLQNIIRVRAFFASIKIQTKQAISSPNNFAKQNTKSVYNCGREKKTDPAQSKIPKALKVSLACKSDACLLEKSYKQRGKPVCFLLFSVTSIIRPLDIVSERRAFVSWCSDKLAGQHLSQRARPIIHCFAKSCESCCGEAK